jgi:Fur family ferric uptake transcriptional regulator
MQNRKLLIAGFTKQLREQGFRLTSERLKLLDAITAMGGHFSPETLLIQIKAKGIPVSRATVYRLLPLLVKLGVIQQSLLSKEGRTHFEVSWQQEHHDHLICSKCGKIIEFQNSTIEALQHDVARKYGFVLDHHVMELVGRCAHCLIKKCKPTTL